MVTIAVVGVGLALTWLLLIHSVRPTYLRDLWAMTRYAAAVWLLGRALRAAPGRDRTDEELDAYVGLTQEYAGRMERIRQRYVA